MKSSLIAFSCYICLLLSAQTSLAQEKQISLSYVNYPPYYGETLENGGPITEIIVSAFNKQGYSVSLELLPWSRALEWTKEGKYDGIFTAWFREERKEFFAFSSPLPANEVVLFKLKERDISYQNYSDLKPYSIGVVRGYANPQGFDEAGLKLAAVTTDKQNFMKLAGSRIDLALADKATGKYLIKTEIPDMVDKIDWIEPPLKIDTQHIMFSKQAAHYLRKLEDFNKGLATITASGELENILQKHGM
jgi:polar amino acid transport system substrate-binding protein